MKQDRKKAVFIAEKMFAELVFDLQKLEGMPFTQPEVQTYLQGITVGGHNVTDEDKLKQQILGWKHLISLVRTGDFALTKDIPAPSRKSSPKTKLWKSDNSVQALWDGHCRYPVRVDARRAQDKDVFPRPVVVLNVN